MSTINITQKAINTPTIDAQFKHIRSYGTTELKSEVFIDAYDAAQPDAKAVGNAGKSGYIELGSNQKSFPVGLYGKDTQYTAANPNRGKLSIKPNIGAANNTPEKDELMGIGEDDSNAIPSPMPTGAWIRCRNDAANQVNAAFSLTNLPEGGGATGATYSCVVNNLSDPNDGHYNMYYKNITASVETSTSVITIEPTNNNKLIYTLNAPPNVATGASIILSGNVITQNNAFAGRVTTTGTGPYVSSAISITGLTTNAVIMLTCVSAANGGIFYTPSAGSFIISATGANATVAYQVIEL